MCVHSAGCRSHYIGYTTGCVCVFFSFLFRRNGCIVVYIRQKVVCVLMGSPKHKHRKRRRWRWWFIFLLIAMYRDSWLCGGQKVRTKEGERERGNNDFYSVRGFSSGGSPAVAAQPIIKLAQRCCCCCYCSYRRRRSHSFLPFMCVCVCNTPAERRRRRRSSVLVLFGSPVVGVCVWERGAPLFSLSSHLRKTRFPLSPLLCALQRRGEEQGTLLDYQRKERKKERESGRAKQSKALMTRVKRSRSQVSCYRELDQDDCSCASANYVLIRQG